MRQLILTASTLRRASGLRCATATATAAASVAAGHRRPFTRAYATQHSLGTTTPSNTRRRPAVTPFNDDGHVPWAELSAAEKTARATQQTFNFGLILVGVVLTGAVSYFLYTEVFSPDSKTSYFNRAVDRIRKDPKCLSVLGESNKITAYGDETWNKWRRARPISSKLVKDAAGNEHLVMRFHVAGPLAKGDVHIQLTKHAGQSDFRYEYFYLDVPGHPRIYLENAAAAKPTPKKKEFKLFGVKWN